MARATKAKRKRDGAAPANGLIVVEPEVTPVTPSHSRSSASTSMLVASASASVSPAGAVALAASRFELRMDESICATLEASLINRLKYTTRNYAPKQKEFLQWCAEQPFDPITRQVA
ncbi:hypothetical protein A4X13_0g8923 [Tilletia indica]|uniref:Uncharacterized protein n=1 Tax=Tilletia indica TaxID=43049 RepID=A0A177T4P6_9BASI|nr:hypothetical protein A4X13_0g8923 [Tilletia indica]